VTDWFDGARFGLFVHWDRIAQRGIEISWPLVGGAGALHGTQASLGVADYHASATSFAPARHAVRELSSGRALEHRGRTSILDQMANADPLGELTIRVPKDVLDPLATVIELEIASRT